MDSAIDASKNAVISGKNMAVSFDSSGIHARKWKDDGSGYELNEIAIINNAIVFTDDGWNTAKMAIGKYHDPNIGDTWGIVAPNITGTLLAGQNLVIESVKKDGETAVFRVDGDGAVLHNAKFDIDNGVSHIVLDPVLGFGIGQFPVVTDDNGKPKWDETNAKFWVDMDGNVRVKGIVEAEDFILNGKSVLTEDMKIKNNFLDLGKIQLDGNTGDITLKGNIDLSQASAITWGGNNPNSDTLPTYNNILSALKAANGTTTTFITADAAGAPNIYGANIYGGKIYAGSGYTNNYSKMDENGFHVYTTNGGGFNIHGDFLGNTHHFLNISYYDGDVQAGMPYMNFFSPDGAITNWMFGMTNFSGNCSFTNNVSFGSSKEVDFYGDVSFHGNVSGLKVVFG
jgi:hypothetical protein